MRSAAILRYSSRLVNPHRFIIPRIATDIAYRRQMPLHCFSNSFSSLYFVAMVMSVNKIVDPFFITFYNKIQSELMNKKKLQISIFYNNTFVNGIIFKGKTIFSKRVIMISAEKFDLYAHIFYFWLHKPNDTCSPSILTRNLRHITKLNMSVLCLGFQKSFDSFLQLCWKDDCCALIYFHGINANHW